MCYDSRRISHVLCLWVSGDSCRAGRGLLETVVTGSEYIRRCELHVILCHLHRNPCRQAFAACSVVYRHFRRSKCLQKILHPRLSDAAETGRGSTSRSCGWCLLLDSESAMRCSEVEVDWKSRRRVSRGKL